MPVLLWTPGWKFLSGWRRLGTRWSMRRGKLRPDGTVAVAEGHAWLQYRALLIAGKGGATSYLTGVTIKQIE